MALLQSRRARILIRWLLVFSVLGIGSVVLLALYGGALVDRAMIASRGGAPTIVRAAPLVLASSDPWRSSDLRAALRARAVEVGSGGVLGAANAVSEGDRIYLGGRLVDADGDSVAVEARRDGLRIWTTRGRLLQRVAVRGPVIGTRSGKDDVVRWPVPVEAMAPALLTAVVDVEDRGFLSHAGLSLRGLLRAGVRDLAAGGVRQGGSTITQQLAKILMLRPARSVPRKILEAWLAALLEYRYDKRAILEAYLNRIYLGQDGGWQIQGVAAAAQLYLGKPVAELEIHEAALLAGMIAAPNRFEPFEHANAARMRRGLVLDAMVREGHLDEREAERLRSLPLPTRIRRLRWAPAAQLVEHVLAGGIGAGETVVTLDVDVQAAVAAGSEAGLQGLTSRHSRVRELESLGDPLQVAVVCMSPDGRVLALQGSRRGEAGELNRAVTSRRPIGSLVKPFIVATAFQLGWSANSPLDDEPLSLPVGNGLWEPQNSDGEFHGRIELRQALVESRNVPMVRLGLEVGLETVNDSLRRVSLVPSGTPATLLGAFGATPADLARAFTVFANGGRYPRQRMLDQEAAAMTAVFHPTVTAAVCAILADVPRIGTAAALAGTVSGAFAAKTGTTDDRRDSWFVAIRPRIVTVVWVGTDANKETGLFGATGAMEIWREIDRRLPPIWWSGALPR